MAGPIPSGSVSELDRVRQAVAAYFPVYETRIGPQSVLFAVHVDASRLSDRFDQLRRELARLGYVPILRRETGEEFIEVIRRPRFGPRRPWINVVLLAATVATTVFAGTMIWLTYVGAYYPIRATDVLYGALYFALPLLLILGVHETAHYVVARRYHLDASLPYFIPIPPPYILGTFGAFVSMREPFPDRKSLFDVGAAGPLAGFAMAIPISIAGMFLSVHSPSLAANYCGPSVLGQSYGDLLLGPSLFWVALSAFFPPSIVSLHPLALAGWVGILVTAINLLPAGTLDGGHIFRALLGDRARYVSYAAAATLFVLGLSTLYLGWLLFAFLVLILGLRHPPPLNDTTRLDGKRMALGGVVVAILVSGFVLVPLSAPTGDLGLSHGGYTPLPPVGPGIAAEVAMTIRNGDPVLHGLLYSVSVVNVSTAPGVYLTGAALAAWERSTNWTFVLPNGTQLGPFAGASATLPSADYLAVGAGDSVATSTVVTNNRSAIALVVGYDAFEFCPPPGGGSVTTTITVEFS